MTEIDFLTAFARLLHDGKLRDAFVRDAGEVARQIKLRELDLPAWMSLDSAAVEAQAEVLLRKRLDGIKHIIPQTCKRLGHQLWPKFLAYARAYWPKQIEGRNQDAYQFCQKLKLQDSSVVEQIEWNRLNCRNSTRRTHIYWVDWQGHCGKQKQGIQFLFQFRKKQLELLIYLGF